ncbi:TPA: hypothetical protein ACK3PA_006367 [Burkholderia cenocepacia]
MDLLSLFIGFLLGIAIATLVAIGVAKFRAAVEQLERDEHWFHD